MRATTPISEAVLVMESRGIAPNTRSFSFSDAWTRLYRSQDFYLDMSCEQVEGAAQLQGQLLDTEGSEAQAPGDVVLRDAQAGEVARATLDPSGHFKLTVGAASAKALGHSLHLELSDLGFQVSDFQIA